MTLLDYKRTAPIAIPESREEAKARAHRIEVAVIHAVREWIWTNRPPYCQVCGGTRQAECGGLPDEMHEDPSRAKTRGKPPWERFNLLICGRLCHACHADVTENRMRLVFADPFARFMGAVKGERHD